MSAGREEALDAAPRRAIVGFARDDAGDWTAVLACGHRRHVRHDPPWTLRPWVTSEAGRASRLGVRLACLRCAAGEARPAPAPAASVEHAPVPCRPEARMRTIDLLGGMSWESTALYYRRINEAVRERLGGLRSARIAMISVDFAEIEAMQAAGAWDEAGAALAGEAQRLEAAGADGIVLCTNTMHRVADAIAAATRIPLLHLADATAARVRAAGVRRVGLLGTRFTMEQDFYRGRLAAHGLEVLVPDEADRERLHQVIFGELCLGRVEDRSRQAVAAMVEALAGRGAQGVIEGCTEITMLDLGEATELPRFDTTAIHAEAAVDWALDWALDGAG